MKVPEQLVERWSASVEGRAWLDALPSSIQDLAERWSLAIGAPFTGPDVTASWVAAVQRADATAAVLKIGFPDMEAEHEIAGLRFWDGDPTIRLLEADEQLNAMLLERCVPGTLLRVLPEDEQDAVIGEATATALADAANRAPVSAPLRDDRPLGRRDARERG